MSNVGNNPLGSDNPLGLGKANEALKYAGDLPSLIPGKTPRIVRGSPMVSARRLPSGDALGCIRFAIARQAQRRQSRSRWCHLFHARHRPSVFRHFQDTPSLVAPTNPIVKKKNFESIPCGWGMITTGRPGLQVSRLRSLISEQNPKSDEDGRISKNLGHCHQRNGSEKKARHYYIGCCPAASASIAS